jgi:hypothetical protein
VPKPDPFVLPLQCLRDLKRWLKAAKVRGVVVGGVGRIRRIVGEFASLLEMPEIVEDLEWLLRVLQKKSKKKR